MLLLKSTPSDHTLSSPLTASFRPFSSPELLLPPHYLLQQDVWKLLLHIWGLEPFGPEARARDAIFTLPDKEQ